MTDEQFRHIKMMLNSIFFTLLLIILLFSWGGSLIVADSRDRIINKIESPCKTRAE